MEKTNLKELSPTELAGFVKGLGLPEYRTRQLLHRMYEKGASSVDEITEYSKELRAKLTATAFIGGLALRERLISSDGTEKYLYELEDGETIESVLIPEEGRLTLCVSSQAGCAMGCRFCRTGMDGLRRNLMAWEIVDQVVASAKLIRPRRLTNIVLMGMGEPLRNLPEVSEAILRMTGLLKISRRRITLSTCGIAPAMRELPERAPRVKLAVSLNAVTDETRNKIMPVNRTYPLAEVLAACRAYPLDRRSRITFEYVLLDGINDSTADARRLAALLRGIPSKVNLIPLNEFEGCGYRAPSDERVLGFQAALIQAGLTAIIRKSRGQDILASCGQLSGRRRALKEVNP